MGGYLIDTNAVSHYLSSALPDVGMEFMDTVIDGDYHLSVITEIELRCWRTEKVIEAQVADFIADSDVLPVSADVITHCVSIRRNRKIKTPDAIIAATALAFDYVLITDNTKDFSNINGLKLLNPNLV